MALRSKSSRLRDALALAAILLTTSSLHAADLRTSIDAITSAPPLAHAVWGIDVEDEDGTIVYERNAHQLMIPASNRKLFAAAAAVNCLGADHHFETELWLDGEDVVLRGGGDPTFGGRYYDTPHLAMAPLVDAVRARGVKRVRDVIADVSAFDRTIIPGGWKSGNLAWDYAAPVDAIVWRENAVGDYAVAEPGFFAAAALREELRNAGIDVTGALRLNTTPRTWRQRVASVTSPTVFQMLATVLKNSHNLYTEVLLKDLSLGSTPASYDASLELERRFAIDEAGVAADEFRFVDGSGLAADDLVTPAALIKLLRWINAPQRRGLFWLQMSTPGEGGTLHFRLTELASRLRAKTGTIAGVNTLSGFVQLPDGRYRYFSVMVNHHLAEGSEAVHAIDAIVRLIAQ